MTSPLVKAIEFLKDFGLFDVVLPFLLVFSIVFAILEKTRILGVEEDGKTPKKQINSMVAFVVGLLVVATNKVVTIINEALPNIILLLVMIVLFLILAGTVMKDQKDGFDISQIGKGWQGILVGISFLGVLIVLMTTIRMDNGQSFWDFIWDWVILNWSGTVFAGFIFFLVVVGAMAIVIKPSFKKPNGGEDDD